MAKLSPQDRQEILKEYESGKSLTELSKKYQVSVPTIFYTVKKKSSPSTSRQVRISTQKSRAKAIELLGGKCKKCGFSDPRALQIDHINGGGHKERKSIGGYGVYLKIVHNFEQEQRNYQLLCANCNWIKRYENNEQRWERKK